MRINSKILNIPYVISTTWANVYSIQMEGFPHKPSVVLYLTNGIRYELPAILDHSVIETIFSSHAKYVEELAAKAAEPKMLLPTIPLATLFMGIEEHTSSEESDEECHCMKCQISRALHAEKNVAQDDELDEEVSLEDLRFRLWDIAQTHETLYTVTNPLDSGESYHVSLGDPTGCTCGQKNCEHILAVLNSD